MTGSPPTIQLDGRNTNTRISNISRGDIIDVFGCKLFVNQSKFGRELRAVGANRDAAHASGFDPKKTITRAYIISGFLGAFAGWMLLGRLETSISSLGEGMTLKTVAASSYRRCQPERWFR